MPRKIPPASQWQRVDIIGRYDEIAAPFIEPLRECIATHFPSKPTAETEAAFSRARGALVVLRAAQMEEEGRPRQATGRYVRRT